MKPVLAIILMFSLAACTSRPVLSAATEIPAIAPENHLHQALSVMPEKANFVEFTDWMRIRKDAGFEDLSSTDDWNTRIEFFLAATGKYAMPSFYGVSRLENHSELWGWDSTDLDWEVRSSISIHPNYALKFRSDFDFGPFLAHLKEHRFTKTSYQNISIYSRQADTSLDLIKTTELSILNTAVIEEANLLLMSSDRDTVLLLIDAFQNKSDSLADVVPVQAVIQSLGDTPGAFISSDPCSLLGPSALLEHQSDLFQDTKQIRQQLDSRPLLANYEALGIGYSVEGSESLGLIVLQFSDPEKAAKDLQPRQQLAQIGITRGKNPQPYEKVLFSVSNAEVEGNQIIMEVVPVNNHPSRLFQMVWSRDMIFATCP